jgi:hypothetical protein
MEIFLRYCNTFFPAGSLNTEANVWFKSLSSSNERAKPSID